MTRSPLLSRLALPSPDNKRSLLVQEFLSVLKSHVPQHFFQETTLRNIVVLRICEYSADLYI
jgi:hypothetical protein